MDPELFTHAYLYLEQTVDDGGWRKKSLEVAPLRREEIPALATAVERWYASGAAAFTWKGNP